MIDNAKKPWIDISVPLEDAMVHWPNNPETSIRRFKDIKQGASSNVTMISMGSHTGTHMDAPIHFIEEGVGINNIPLTDLIGKARVIEIRDSESIKPEELTRNRIHRGERILLKTENSLRDWQKMKFLEDYVFISDTAADFLVDRGVRLVGIDYLSVGSFKQGGSYVHKTLLCNGVWIIEGLNLSNVPPGRYDLICLPLRIAGGDGAPARAIIRPAPRHPASVT
ncbi:cyclase family protein [Chloroflexota bacterium]